tara:strand:+ start:377 stop:1060 length:684 start_codon:yes stop_codon:yes gene_type:complete
MSEHLSRKQKQRIRKLKKKIFKLNYLNEELDDVIQTVDEHTSEFNKALRNWLIAHNAEHALDDIFPSKTEEEILAEIEDREEELSESQKNTNADPWVKEIYRQIANETHPDKISQINELTKQEKIKRNDLFIKANKYLLDNNGPELYVIAIDLKLKMKNIPDNILEYFDESASELQEEIRNKQNSHVWYWAESSFDEKVKFISNINKKYEIESNDYEITSFLNDYIK